MVAPSSRPLSDLQKQLVQVRDPATNRTKATHDRYKDSFIFEAKEAAEQDLATIYQIGVEGFNSLVQLDPRFETYRGSLFSEASKGADRITFTQEENSNLDKNIDGFLVLLGPYFLISSAGKAIEWLVRRFRINEFNVDGIIRCIFPYHDTQPFLKFLSILHLVPGSKWSPLIGVRKSKMGLTRTQVVRWLARDSVLLSYVLDMVTEAAIQTPRYSAIFSFYAAVLLGYLQEIPSLADKEVNLILPTAIGGLRSACEDFALASFMIIVHMSSRVSFTTEILDTFAKRLISAKLEFSAVLGAFVLLSHNQPQYFVPGSFNPMIISWALSQKGLVQTLSVIGGTQNVAAFTKYLVWGLIDIVLTSPESSSKSLDLVLSIAGVSCLAVPEVVSELCLHLFDIMEAKPLEEVTPLSQLFKILESQQSDLVQTLIAKHLGELSKGGRANQRYVQLYSLLVGQLQDSISVPLKETNASLASSLIHPDPRFQLAAINKLNELLFTHDCSVYSVLFPSLLSHLSDGTPEVMDATLKMLKQHPTLVKALPSEQLWSLVQALPSSLMKAGFEVILSPEFFMNNLNLCLVPVLDNVVTSKDNQPTHLFVCELMTQVNNSSSVLIPVDCLKTASKLHMGPKAIAAHNISYVEAVSKSIVDAENPAEHLITALSLFSSLRSYTAKIAITIIASNVLKSLLKPRGYGYFRKVILRFEEVLLELAAHEASSCGAISEIAIFEAIALESESSFGYTAPMAVTLSLTNVLQSFSGVATPEAWLKPLEDSNILQSYKATLSHVFRVVGSESLSKFPSLFSMLVNDCLKDGLIAFCCHVLVDDQSPAPVKSRALVLISFYLSQPAAGQGFQLALPFVLASLGHAEECVRFGGVLCLRAFETHYTSAGQAKSDKHGSSASRAFYGNKPPSMDELTSPSTRQLIKELNARQSELQSSAEAFSSVLVSSLSCKASLPSKKGVRSLSEPFLDVVIAHIRAMSSVEGQLALLGSISPIDNKSKLRGLSQMLSHNLKIYAEKAPTDVKHHALLGCLLDLFTPSALKALDAKNPRYINALIYALGIDAPCGGATVSQMVLERVTPELFLSLGDKSQALLLKALLSISTGDSDDTAPLAKATIFSLQLSKFAVQDTLTELRSLFLAPEKPIKKTKADAAVVPVYTRPMAQLTVLLDAINSRDESASFLGLESILFELLTQLEEASIRPVSTSSNYLYQMLLSVLANILNCAQTKGSAVSEVGIKVDVVVQLLQLPAQPQTHHQALRLVSATAALFPQKILSYVMPIFTFMGTSASKKDDNYSFFIIQETIAKIIPPLIQNFQLESMTESDQAHERVLLAKPLVSVFVNALLKIPQHRRIKLFTILISTLGGNFLYGVLGVILEIYATHHAQGSRDDAVKLRDFCVEIAGQFHPNTQVKGLTQLLDSVLQLPNEKPREVDPSFRNIYALADHSEKHLRHYKYAVVNFIRETLNQGAFLHQLLEIEAGSEEAARLDADYVHLAESLLELADSFRDHLTTLSAQPAASKFFTQLVGFVYDVLDNVINLLSLPCFTSFLAKLLFHTRSTIRYRSMQLLEAKLEAYHTQLSENEARLFIELIPTLAKLATGSAEVTVNRQSALNCLGMYIQCFSHHHGVSEAKTFSTHIVPVLLGEHGLASTSWPIFASSCHVASFLCQELSLSLIEHIPVFVPLLLEQMEKSFSIDSDALANNVWLSEFVLLESVFTKLAKFTSPYLPQTITQLIAFKGKLAEGPADLTLSARINSMLDLLHLHLEPRILLPILFKLYSPISSTGRTAVEAFFDILSNVIISLSQEDVEKLYILLFKFYLECLDFRHFHKEYSQQDISTIEDMMLQSFILLVMKLRDDMFKPIFLKLGEWATHDLKNTPQGQDRLIVFYHFLDLTLSKLKHIFAPYFIYTLDHCIESLGSYSKTSTTDQLWGYLLSSLAYSMQFDTEGVWTIESFNKLLPKLIQQFDIVQDLSVAEASLVPCFDWLCSAVTSESAWKTLNNQVALKTRDDSATVKCIALKTLRAFYLRQKDSFLVLLPETIPFLAEVMEDDTEEVVRCTRDLILTIERFSGESLDKYFR
ncbi:snoRNA-binding rRNA-processing protein utp10 [Entomophthora muscae]|uniref:SnoRNA-binding rRNA-processing protein utp10 n=1 Tax=Entomophthora muscae TaxID=34485 RepID=A0ACC2TFL2_9FUNG|nr:snoRNA-binding rRNA-processing protein utp10 [Entomophthora muscae]